MRMVEPKIINSGIRDVSCGEGVTIVLPSNLYECRLDDDVFIGPFVEIQSGVKVGSGTVIQSHSFVCELVTIGRDCRIAHGVMFINDRFRSGRPAMGERHLWETTNVGDGVLVGSNATILPVTICDGAVIGAGSVVTRSITRPGIYAGNPARLMRGL